MIFILAVAHGFYGVIKMSTELEKNAIKIALEKLKMDGTRAPPDIVRSSTRWNPVLLRRISEVSVRADERAMMVRQDVDTGETIGWRYTDTQPSSTQVKLTKEEALEIAKEEIDIPSDAVLDSVELQNKGSAGYVYLVKWMHMIDNIEVENDYILVKINPETKEVISATINWSEVVR